MKNEYLNSDKNKNNRMLTSDGICEWLSIKKSFLYRLVNTKQFPVIKLGHRSLRFDRKLVQRWLDAHKQGLV